MCVPLAAAPLLYASLAMTVASTAASFIGQQQQANKQQAFQNKQYAEAQKSANASFIAQASQENLRLQQEDTKKVNEQFQTNIGAAKATSTATVAAGEAGVSGVSVNGLLADFERSRARYGDVLTQNFEMDRLQSGEQVKGLSAQRDGRINQFLPGPVERPSFLGAALRIGGGALQSFDTFSSVDKATGVRSYR